MAHTLERLDPHDRQTPLERFDELRNLAVACLALPDWQTLRQWEGFPQGSFDWSWDEPSGRFARYDLKGTISVRHLENDVEIAPLTFAP